jgi:hypothetical protein
MEEKETQGAERNRANNRTHVYETEVGWLRMFKVVGFV